MRTRWSDWKRASGWWWKGPCWNRRLGKRRNAHNYSWWLNATDSPKYSIVSVCTMTKLLQTCGTVKSQISSLLLTRLSVLSFNLLGLYQFFYLHRLQKCFKRSKLMSANKHLFCNIKLIAVIPCESHGEILFPYLRAITNLSAVNIS